MNIHFQESEASFIYGIGYAEKRSTQSQTVWYETEEERDRHFNDALRTGTFYVYPRHENVPIWGLVKMNKVSQMYRRTSHER